LENEKISSNYSGLNQLAKTQKKRIQKIIKEENLDNALVPLNETLKKMDKTSRNNFLENLEKLDDRKVKNLLGNKQILGIIGEKKLKLVEQDV
jgi:hypothetical protein